MNLSPAAPAPVPPLPTSLFYTCPRCHRLAFQPTLCDHCVVIVRIERQGLS